MKVLKRGYAVGRRLIGKNGDRGYAMPVAIGFGLAILMVSAALLLRSQNDDVTANLQEATGGSLNVAESGVAKVQSFINNNRSVATYNLSAWTNARTTVSTNNLCGPTSTTDIVAYAANARNWQNVDPSNPSKGQYRVVNYTYVANDSTRPNSAPGTGTLEVEGRLPNQSSVNALRVTIPVQAGDMSGVPIPGLWLSGNGATGNNAIRGNVLVNNCSVPLSSIQTAGADAGGQPYRAYYTTMQLPPLPSIPPSGPPLNSLPNSINTLTLPRNGDRTTTRTLNNGRQVQVHEYIINGNLDISNSGSLTITPGARVTFYLTGNIPSGGNIIHNCDTAAPGVECNATNFQVFGYGTVNGPDNFICLSGNTFTDMFLLAPTYTAGVAGAGTGGTGGTAGIRGSAWVRDWNSRSGSTTVGCGSNTTNFVVTQTGSWDLMSVMPLNLPPRFSPISTWQRQNAAP
jgi:hypothetical protein